MSDIESCGQCDDGYIITYKGMTGYWIFENCPHHFNKRNLIEKCKYCDSDGQMEVFIECEEE